MAILQLRAMRGGSKVETPRHFRVTDDTIRSWLRRADDDSLFKTRPVSEDVTAALDRIMEVEQAKPKHLIVDQGREFRCKHFKQQS